MRVDVCRACADATAIRYCRRACSDSTRPRHLRQVDSATAPSVALDATEQGVPLMLRWRLKSPQSI